MARRFVWFDNAMANPALVAITPELIDEQDLSPSERVRLRVWLIAQKRVEANAPRLPSPPLLDSSPPLRAPAAIRRLAFEEEAGGACNFLAVGDSAAAGLGGIGDADADEELNLYLSKLSTEEGVGGLSLLEAAMTIYEEDEQDEQDEKDEQDVAPAVVDISDDTPVRRASRVRRPRVAFADSPPQIVGYSVAEGSSASSAIVIGVSPPHKKNRAKGE
jgi:hypothetical protein